MSANSIFRVKGYHNSNKDHPERTWFSYVSNAPPASFVIAIIIFGIGYSFGSRSTESCGNCLVSPDAVFPNMTVTDAHTSLGMEASAPWFIPNADKLVTVNNKTLTYDDIIFGYDLIFEKHRMFSMTHWMGMYFQQDPSDAMALHDLFWRLKIDLLIEIGTDTGGAAIFYSSFMRMYNPNALVITIDPKHVSEGSWDKGNGIRLCPDCVGSGIDHPLWDEKYIHFIHGTPTDATVLAEVERIIEERGGFKQVVVMEDGNHAKWSVLPNINAYENFVTVGSYLVVQDTKLDRMNPEGEGPLVAVNDFLENQGKQRYIRDVQWEYLLYSQHHGGFLKKVKE